MSDLKSQIINLLEIINYKGDKNKFAEELFKTIYASIINDLISKMANDKKQALDLQLKNKSIDLNAFASIIKDNFDSDTIDKVVENRVKVVLSDYILQVTPTLSDSQLENLRDYLETYKSSQLT